VVQIPVTAFVQLLLHIHTKIASSRLAQVVKILICVWGIPSLNVGQDGDCHDTIFVVCHNLSR
jgi:hypothetical protein